MATTAGPNPTSAQALQDALAQLVPSLAQLAVARGIPYADIEAMLKLAFVQAAAAAHPGLPEHRKVSRVSTTTGINRREVTRLMALRAAPTRSLASPSVAAEVFTVWRSTKPYIAANGQARPLPRQGPAPSFESLAQTVTRDVHPRSLLDELCRLGLAVWDSATDEVSLVHEPFVPHGDQVRLLGFLGSNVGDHLRAAVANVLGDDRTHFEQAVYADGLSEQAITAMRPAIAAQWQALLQALVPALQAHVDQGKSTTPPPQGRLRVGLYSYHEAASHEPAAAPAVAPALPLKPRKAASRRVAPPTATPKKRTGSKP
jgi:Family of unknown function (DUF6502)